MHPLFLVIDDDEVDRISHTRMLSELGFSVITANDGQGGIEAFRSNRDQVVGIITDLNMNEVDGADVVAAVRQARPEIPVFVASAGIETASHRPRLRHAAALLEKPVTSRRFRDTMNEVINCWLPRVLAAEAR